MSRAPRSAERSTTSSRLRPVVDRDRPSDHRDHETGTGTDPAGAEQLFRDFVLHSHFEPDFLSALSGTHWALKLKLCTNSIANSLQTFFLTCPKIHSVCFEFGPRPRNKRPLHFNQRLLAAAATARIKQASFYMACPADLIGALAVNRHIEKVIVHYDFRVVDAETLWRTESDIIDLLRSSRNATFQLELHFDRPLGRRRDDYDHSVFYAFWEGFTREAQDHAALSLLFFREDGIDNTSYHFYTSTVPAIFRTTDRTLLLGYFTMDDTISAALFAALFGCVRHLRLGEIPQSRSGFFFELLADPQCALRSIDIGHIYSDSDYIEEQLQHFTRHIPRLSPNLASLRVVFEFDFYSDRKTELWKRRIIKALWQNQTLSTIDVDGDEINDDDRAAIRHIAHRNSSRIQILEQKRRRRAVPRSMWAPLLKHSIHSGLYNATFDSTEI